MKVEALTKSMPETLAKINRALKDLSRTAGDVEDIRGKFLMDDEIGVFLELTFVLTDGSWFKIQTIENQELWKRAHENAKRAELH